MPPRPTKINIRVLQPWENDQYRKKLVTLYKLVHPPPEGMSNDAIEALAQNLVAWLPVAAKERGEGNQRRVSALEELMVARYADETSASLSSYMSPVAAGLWWIHRKGGQYKLLVPKDLVVYWLNAAKEKRQAYDAMIGNKRRDETFKDYAFFVNERQTYYNQWQQSFEKTPLGGKGDVRVYWKYFVLCLYTLQPPIRLQWGKMKIEWSKPHKVEETINTLTNEENKRTNFLLVVADRQLPARSANSAGWAPVGYKMIVNVDKVSDTYKFRDKPVIDVTPELSAVLTHSLITFRPRVGTREYVVPKYNLQLNQATEDGTKYDKPIGEQPLGASLRKRYGLEKPIDNMRRAYATAIHTDSSKTFNEMTKIARAMRHNLTTALLHYRRPEAQPGKYPEAMTPEELAARAVGAPGAGPAAPGPAAAGTRAKAPPRGPGPYRRWQRTAEGWDRQAWWERYKEEKADQIAATRKKYRQKTKMRIEQRSRLWELNNGKILKPRPSTLERLAIEMDGVQPNGRPRYVPIVGRKPMGTKAYKRFVTRRAEAQAARGNV